MIVLKNIDKNALFPVTMEPDTNTYSATARIEDVFKKINKLT